MTTALEQSDLLLNLDHHISIDSVHLPTLYFLMLLKYLLSLINQHLNKFTEREFILQIWKL